MASSNVSPMSGSTSPSKTSPHSHQLPDSTPQQEIVVAALQDAGPTPTSESPRSCQRHAGQTTPVDNSSRSADVYRSEMEARAPTAVDYWVGVDSRFFSFTRPQPDTFLPIAQQPVRAGCLLQTAVSHCQHGDAITSVGLQHPPSFAIENRDIFRSLSGDGRTVLPLQDVPPRRSFSYPQSVRQAVYVESLESHTESELHHLPTPQHSVRILPAELPISPQPYIPLFYSVPAVYDYSILHAPVPLYSPREATSSPIVPVRNAPIHLHQALPEHINLTQDQVYSQIWAQQDYDHQIHIAQERDKLERQKQMIQDNLKQIELKESLLVQEELELRKQGHQTLRNFRSPPPNTDTVAGARVAIPQLPGPPQMVTYSPPMSFQSGEPIYGISSELSTMMHVPDSTVHLDASYPVHEPFVDQYNQAQKTIADSSSETTAQPIDTVPKGLDPRLRSTAEPFVPHLPQPVSAPTSGQHQTHHHYHHQHHHPQRFFNPSRRYRDVQPQSSVSGCSGFDVERQRVKEELHQYALRVLAPGAKTSEEALELIARKVVRVPAVYFNEQKLEDMVGYQVLRQPQSPAVRGQEAVARVCLALEQCLSHLGLCAFMICDYKYKENYLRHAPQYVLDVLDRPTEYEGSHDVLLLGPEIGVVCVQVTCIETTTNSSTVKKQVRDALKQLQKDVKFIESLLVDLDAKNHNITTVLALPNITVELLKQKLEPKTLQDADSDTFPVSREQYARMFDHVQNLTFHLRTSQDLEELLTLDCLPPVGQRHWPCKRRLDRLLAFFRRHIEKRKYLILLDCLQIFARYTCPWSQTDVWGLSKPRVQVRTEAHAVAETYFRHSGRILTARQHELLQMEQARHVLIEGAQGCGAALLLQLKALLDIQKGCDVAVFLPQRLTGLRQQFKKQLQEILKCNYQQSSGKYDVQSSGKVYFWSGADINISSEMSYHDVTLVPFVDGSPIVPLTLSTSSTGRDITALFYLINRDEDLFTIILPDVMERVSSVWVVADAVFRHRVTKKFLTEQFHTLTRVPASIQGLIKQAACKDTKAAPGVESSFSGVEDTPSLVPVAADLSETSSYLGLATDGPQPLFIFHPNVQKTEKTNSADLKIIDCDFCMGELRNVIVNLFANCSLNTTSRQTSVQTNITGNTSLSQNQTFQKPGPMISKKEEPLSKSQKPTGDQEVLARETEAENASMATQYDATFSLQEAEGEQISVLDADTGNVPKRLSAEDFLVLTDTPKEAEALFRALNQIDLRDAIQSLANTDTFTGTEKAVVVYVGKVKERSNMLTDLVLKLREIITLCQSQLIFVLQVDSESFSELSSKDEDSAPYHLLLETLLEKATRQGHTP